MEKPVQTQNSKHDSSHDKKDGVQGAKAQHGDAAIMMRDHAISHALELHRGKGLEASKLVTEAAVIEAYLLEGATEPKAPTVN